MKKYVAPQLKETIFSVQDVIAVSGDVTNIVSQSDAESAVAIQEATWSDSWD